MTESSRQVRRAAARRAAKNAGRVDPRTGALVQPPRVSYDPLYHARLQTSKYLPHIGARERGRHVVAV